MSIIQDVVKGALKLATLPDRVCFSSWRDFLEQLPKMLSVEIPANLGGVVTQQAEPGVDDRNKLWLRIDPSGNVINLYAYQQGNWEILVTDTAYDIKWTVGDSNTPQNGYTVILPGDTLFPNSVVSVLVAQYIPLAPGPGYLYFATRFSGY